ncbi:MAG: sensor histidine kinase [Segetibacter sp.]|nr:sensor histidine kinase [Segetibacter sp.]
MKLLNKYSRAHIITACIVLLVSSAVYYFIIRSILLKQIDKDLKVEEQEIIDFINANKSLPHASDYKHQQIKFEVLRDKKQFRETINTIEFDEREKEYEPYRRLSFPVEVKGVRYKAFVYKSQVETEDLLRLIMILTATIFIVLSILMFIINRFVLRELWQPFFNTLSQLKNFDLHTHRQLILSKSSVEEFEELNKSVFLMTEKVSNEYESLKAFTDNASHEMQTPIAIIRSKLDLLIQSAHESQEDQLQAIYEATGKLSKLNQALLLLTKIDNHQFGNPKNIKFKRLIEEKILQFDELLKAKDLKLTHNLSDVCIKMNSELADILLNNLFSNAIKHNFPGGRIECILNENKLSVSNSGPQLSFDKMKIFERFQKRNNSDGIGLGLAVVKEICDASGFTIAYLYADRQHTFNVMF